MKTHETARRLDPLRPYQREVARAIVESVMRRRGLSFSVEIARQGGKNELSSRVELLLLEANMGRQVTSIKVAPTLRPQALISLRRLWDRVCDAQLDGLASRENGNCVRLGRARQLFLSAEPHSNVVGHTADLLLEVDEAQDVDIDKFDKELQPMAAANGATTVFYGTAWDDANLLERSKQTHLDLERRDGRRRHFEYDWQTVAATNPAYGRFVAGERERLGETHPLFLSQYCLRSLPGTGRLFSPQTLALLRGMHGTLDAPVAGETYVAGLDVAGEEAEGDRREHDATVLSIGRVVEAQRDDASGNPLTAPGVEVVRHYVWNGAAHGQLYGALLSLLRETWRVQRVSVDAAGIGEPLASFLANALGPSRVEAVKLTSETKSKLGYELLTAANGGRLRLYAGPAAADCWRQLERCRAVYRPNQTMSFFVDQRDGHDDHVISLELLLAAAATGGPRRARGRPGN